MKVSFTDLLDETQEIFSEQPPEVRQAMEDVSNFVIDVNVKNCYWLFERLSGTICDLFAQLMNSDWSLRKSERRITVKLSKIDNIMIIMVFIFTILLFLYFIFAFYLTLCILTGSWIKLFINKKGKK